MIRKWILFISSRYMQVGRKNRRFTATLLSGIGIAVGVTALITVISVMNGFQMGFIEDILEISSFHVMVEGIDADSAAEIRKLPAVRSVMPFKDTQSIISTDYSLEPCLIKGIPPDFKTLDPGFSNQLNITDGELGQDDRSVIIGRTMAYRLGVNIGDTVSLMSLNGGKFNAMRPVTTDFRISGFFRSGYGDFDSSLMITNLEDIEVLDGITKIKYGVKLKNRFRTNSAIQSISDIAGNSDAVSVTGWQEYNRAFFGALKLEKNMMFILLGLIFLVVSFGIFNSTRRTVFEKQEEIGILRAIGATPSNIRNIFIIDGFIIGAGGGLIGVVFGLLITFNINNILGLLSLRTAGFLIDVPVRVVPSEVTIIFSAAVIFCIAAAAAASARVSRIMPQEVLRYE